MVKRLISAFIITFNEEAHIAECLDSLDFCEEIIVVDSGSTDKTVELAQMKGAKVFFNKFEGYRDQKQFALNQCTLDWVISLDADERISPELRAFILLQDFSKCEVNGFEVRRSHFFENKKIKFSGLYPDYKLRLFKRDKGLIIGENIHEIVKVHGKTKKLLLDILHFSWKNKSDLLNKQLNYAKKVGQNKFLKGETSNLLEAWLKGLFAFFYRFIIRLGFLDGWLGLFISYVMGLATFHKYQTVYNLNQQSAKPPFPSGVFFKIILKPIQLFYKTLILTRLWAHQKKILKKKKLPIPVISVGNLSTGGSGKTPFTIWLTNLLLNKKKQRIAIISRGYKSKVKENQVQLVTKNSSADALGDEPVFMHHSINSSLIDIIVSPNRYQGGLFAIEKCQSNLIILDDGFQHLQLERDLNICLIDCSDKHFHELLPLGSLREPLSGINRADVIILTRTHHNTLLKELYLEKILKITKENLIYELEENILSFYNLHNKKSFSLEGLKDKRVIIFCALGNPEQFYTSLLRNGITIIDQYYFPDHYSYKKVDILLLYKKLKEQRADILITTEKDAVKLEIILNLTLDNTQSIRKSIWVAKLNIQCIKPLYTNVTLESFIAQKIR